MAEVKVINPIASPETNKLRVCAYARVSSDSEDQLNSFIAQVKHYTELINGSDEWELVDVYEDEGLTGTRADKREDFQRMLKDCRKGKIDRILTKSISRFARNTKDCLQTLRELKALGVEVEFEKEQINTGKITSEMMVSFFSSAAQEESVSISSNMRLGCRMRMRKGTYINPSAPFGYQLVDRNLIIREDEAKVVRRIFESYLAGKGIDKIADELSEEKIPKKHGGTRWHYDGVAYILTNERYIGDTLLQKKFTTDTLPFKLIINKGQKDRYYIHNSHEPIISRSDFEQAKLLLEKRNRIHYQQKPPQQYPLSRKIRCGGCGYSFKRKVCSGKTYWVCRSHDQGKDRCGIKQIEEPEFYKAFVRMYNKLKPNCRYILNPLLDQLLALKSRSTMSSIKVSGINKEIAELTDQNLILNRLRSKGYMGSDIFMEQTNEINQKINNLRSLRRKLLGQDEDDKTIAAVKDLIAVIEDGPPALADLDEPLFNSIVDTITVESQDKIRFRLTGGLELNEPI
ncbi:MAG: recombinase family protein [Firmicutes bacterium]|nr:recombinase family protein [Bacillota bacterium]